MYCQLWKSPENKFRATIWYLVIGTPEEGKCCPLWISPDVWQVGPTWRKDLSGSTSWSSCLLSGRSFWHVCASTVGTEGRGRIGKPHPLTTYFSTLNTWHLLYTVCLPPPLCKWTDLCQCFMQLELFFFPKWKPSNLSALSKQSKLCQSFSSSRNPLALISSHTASSSLPGGY